VSVEGRIRKIGFVAILALEVSSGVVILASSLSSDALTVLVKFVAVIVRIAVDVVRTLVGVVILLVCHDACKSVMFYNL
jgi:hypothetical protein